MRYTKAENEAIRKMAEQKGIAFKTVKKHLREGMTLAEALMKKHSDRRVIVKKIPAEKMPVEPKKPRSLREFKEERMLKAHGKLTFIRTGASGGYYDYVVGEKE